MHFTTSTVLILSTLLSTALSAPTVAVQKRALTARPYSEFQISSGTAGDALNEVMQKFPVRIYLRTHHYHKVNPS